MAILLFCKTKFQLIVCLLVLSATSYAQQQSDRHQFILSNLDTDNCLSSARIYSIMQGEDNAMWFGTKNGVDRYNGNTITNYHLYTKTKFSDACGRIIQMASDNKKNIYAYDNKGKVFSYNNTLDKFELKYDLNNYIPGYVILNKIFIDDKDNFYFALTDGLYLINKEGVGRWIKKKLWVCDINGIDNICNKLVIGTNNGVYIYISTRRRIKYGEKRT